MRIFGWAAWVPPPQQIKPGIEPGQILSLEKRQPFPTERMEGFACAHTAEFSRRFRLLLGTPLRILVPALNRRSGLNPVVNKISFMPDARQWHKRDRPPLRTSSEGKAAFSRLEPARRIIKFPLDPPSPHSAKSRLVVRLSFSRNSSCIRLTSTRKRFAVTLRPVLLFPASTEFHPQHVGIFRRRPCWQLDMQAVQPLLVMQRRIAAHQGKALYGFLPDHLPQRANYYFRVGRPSQAYRVQHVPFRSKAKVFGGVGCRLGVMKRSRRNFRRTFAEFLQGRVP